MGIYINGRQVAGMGVPGKDGKDGAPGAKGDPFTYEDFTPEQLEALRGADGTDGADGKSAYQIAQEAGYTGSEADFAQDLQTVGRKIDRPESAEAGQVLTFDGAQWTAGQPGSAFPEGGTDGQAILKTAEGEAWAYPQTIAETIAQRKLTFSVASEVAAGEDSVTIEIRENDEGDDGYYVSSFAGRSGTVMPQAGDYTAAMVGARADDWMPSAAEIDAVPAERMINGRPLSGDVTLDAAAVGARAADWVPTIDEVGAASAEHTHTADQVGADAKGAADGALAAAKAYADQQIAAIPKPDVSAEIGAHNTSAGAHSDIRQSISTHIADTVKHVTAAERSAWNGKAEAGHTHTAAQVGAAAASHKHAAGDLTSGTLPVARGGTGVSNMSGTDYTTSRPRGIALMTSVPSSIPNGCIVGVYET